MTTQRRQIAYILNGGINSNTQSELLANNEMQYCENYEYINGKLQVRGGISSPLITFSAPILGAYYDFETNVIFVALTNNDLYKTDLTTTTLLGKLSGTLKPICAKFGSKVFFASGGKLQSYDYSSFVTIDTSPLCDIVFERLGRILISKSGDDYLHYSAVGDETDWVDDPNIDSSSKDIEVGYKDGGDIVSVVQMSTDIFIFKSNGFVYQLTGEYPDWACYRIASDTDVDYRFCSTNIGNEVAFVGKRGLMTLATVTDYGNVKVQDIGTKFNNLLSKTIYHPTVWNMRRKNQLAIRPYDSEDIWLYQYDMGVATLVKFPQMIIDFMDTSSGIVVASGSSLYYWGDYDEVIETTFTTKKESSIAFMIMRKLDISVVGTGSLNVYIGKKCITLNFTPTRSRFVLRLNKRLREFEIKVTSSDKLFLNHIMLEV